jgi:hypothetical protein
MVVGKAMGVEVAYTHCLVFLKIGDSVAVCDNSQSEVFWHPKVPRDQAGNFLVAGDHFD